MKEWLRILPFPILIFCVLTFLDFYTNPAEINWLWNLIQAAVLGAIGCVGQFLIHRNILQDSEEDKDDTDGCINCGKF